MDRNGGRQEGGGGVRGVGIARGMGEMGKPVEGRGGSGSGMERIVKTEAGE